MLKVLHFDFMRQKIWGEKKVAPTPVRSPEWNTKHRGEGFGDAYERQALSVWMWFTDYRDQDPRSNKGFYKS